MKLIRGLHNLTLLDRGATVAIGNFDGVHLGHQALLEAALNVSNTQSMVMIFEPQPQEFFAPQHAPARLTSLREKCMLFEKARIQKVLCIFFNRDFANVSAQAFMQTILREQLACHTVVVGEDFRFGQDRGGCTKDLQQFGMKHGMNVISVPSVRYEGHRVSSSVIRKALSEGNLAMAECLLGHPYDLFGRVMHGDKRGRAFGFPTANIQLSRLKPALSGVFMVQVYGVVGEGALPAVANLGVRPTVGGEQMRLEVHILNFDRELYGQHLKVRFLKKLRGEQTFESIEALKMQITKDVESAKTYFNYQVEK